MAVCQDLGLVLVGDMNHVVPQDSRAGGGLVLRNKHLCDVLFRGWRAI